MAKVEKMENVNKFLTSGHSEVTKRMVAVGGVMLNDFFFFFYAPEGFDYCEIPTGSVSWAQELCS